MTPLTASRVTEFRKNLKFEPFALTGRLPSPHSLPSTHAASGHFHLIIDGEKVVPTGEAIPFDAAHMHFGKGQTSVDVELPAGKHSLTLQFANIKHESYGPAYAKNITVNVQ